MVGQVVRSVFLVSSVVLGTVSVLSAGWVTMFGVFAGAAAVAAVFINPEDFK